MRQTFDTTLVRVADVLRDHTEVVEALGPMLVNRDLFGRVRLIVRTDRAESVSQDGLARLTTSLSRELGPHGYPPESLLILEEDLATGDIAPTFPLEGFPAINVVDRLASEADWGRLAPRSSGAPRVVFFSIKGGVGRSTSVAVVAAILAERGHRVMVIDLDLASPGLSSTLLTEDRRPAFGIIDWLVEDLVDNGDAVLTDIYATTGLIHDGEIVVVPAHGSAPGDYIAKLGRAWMPKFAPHGRERWAQRLSRLVTALEARWTPDIVLIDSRSGVDDIASTCVTELGAELVLLFAADSPQTWTGYRVVFDYWRRSGAILAIRERLQCVGVAVPTEDEAAHATTLRETAWNHFVEGVYDEVPAGQTVDLPFSFDRDDEDAPHAPWQIRWDRAFVSVASWLRAFGQIDGRVMQSAFGAVVDGIEPLIAGDPYTGGQE